MLNDTLETIDTIRSLLANLSNCGQETEKIRSILTDIAVREEAYERNVDHLTGAMPLISTMTQMLRDDCKIEAVKYVRSTTGMSLFESLQFVNRFIDMCGNPIGWARISPAYNEEGNPS